jgi:hypothetical protein
VSTFELTRLVTKDITCLPTIVLFCNESNNVQQSLAEVIWFNIPIDMSRKICAVLYYSLVVSMICFMVRF